MSVLYREPLIVVYPRTSYESTLVVEGFVNIGLTRCSIKNLLRRSGGCACYWDGYAAGILPVGVDSVQIASVSDFLEYSKFWKHHRKKGTNPDFGDYLCWVRENTNKIRHVQVDKYATKTERRRNLIKNLKSKK